MRRLAFVLLSFLLLGEAQAQTKLRLSLDWVFEGQTAFLQLARYKGYFADEGLDVQVDVGNGSAGGFQRIVSGAYDAALADMSSQIVFVARNPSSAQFHSVYVQYDQFPAGYFALKKSGIRSVKDFPGHAMLETPGGFGRRVWPLVAKAAGVDPGSLRWVSASPALRATMLINGDADIIAGFLSIPIDLNRRGVKDEDIVAMPLFDYGINYYGNSLIVSQKLIDDNPKAVAGLVRAFNRALREALADPAEAIRYLKKREPLVDEKLEIQRMQFVMPGMLTPHAREAGLGAIDPERLQHQIEQVSEAYAITNPPTIAQLFDARFLPPQAERMPK